MTNREALEIYLEKTLQDLLKESRAKGFYASGKTHANTFTEVKPDGSEGMLHAPRHIETTFKGIGRKPGTMPPVLSIQEWIKIKGLNLNPWATAKRMMISGNAVYRGAREGIDFKSIKAKHFEEFKQNCLAALKQSVQDGIREGLKGK